ncbi:hypothetical protein F4V58_09660 [Corynebacterium phocae]|nr:hypothetical protein F4V58_09660 [Corynebacterium phocae]
MVESLDNPEVRVVLHVANTGAKPFFASATDGHDYWCKHPNGPQGADAAACEVAAGVVGDALGAPIPKWSVLTVSEDLQGIYLDKGGYLLDDQPVFASRSEVVDIEVLESPGILRHTEDDRNFERIPLLFALWFLCNAEDIQFFYDQMNDFSIYSVDHAFWFGSQEAPWGFGDFKYSFGRPEVPFLKPGSIAGNWSGAIESVARLDEHLAAAIRARMPRAWDIGTTIPDEIADYVLGRKEYAIGQLEQLELDSERRGER